MTVRFPALPLWGLLLFCGLSVALWGGSISHEGPGRRPWVEVSPAMTRDGRVVVFEACRATVASTPPRAFCRRGGSGEPVLMTDILLVDLETERVEVVSRARDGTPADGPSRGAVVDAQGRRVAFESEASNLVADDRNAMRDVFVYERATGACRRIVPPGQEMGAGAACAPVLSGDGGRVAFETYALIADRKRLRLRQPVIADLATGAFPPILAEPGVGLGPSHGRPALSPDGCRIAFSTFAPDLLGSDGRHIPGIVLVEALGARPPLTLVSATPRGTGANAPSYTPVLGANACAFISRASDLVEGDANGGYDVFVRDLATRRTERVSVASSGTEGNDDSFEPSISEDGRFVAFTSHASNLVAGDGNRASDVFLHDRATHETRLVSHRPDGAPGNGASYHPCVSGDGGRIAFVTLATDLEGRDVPASQVYVWDRATDRLRRVPLRSAPPGGAP